MDATVISFDDWEQVLKTVVPTDRQRLYREAIIKFRYWLRETGKTACAEAFKEHLAWKQSYLAPERFAIRQEALRWYYREGRNRMAGQNVSLSNRDTLNDRTQGRGIASDLRIQPAPGKDLVQGFPRTANRSHDEYRIYSMNDVPSAGARDLGGPEWEQTLVRRIREKNLAWNSEKTYRSWCRRFMSFSADKPLAELNHSDIRQ